jgi:gamma-glutamyltranspeptidase/glutathione hydrolase
MPSGSIKASRFPSYIWSGEPIALATYGELFSIDRQTIINDDLEVVPGFGVSLQNRGAGFSSDPRSANVVAPGKRPFHTIIPAFLTREGQPQMSFGVMGGDMQPQGHVQTLVRMLDFNQQPQAACDAPRWKVNPDYSLDLESRFDPQVAADLQARGQRLHSVNDPYMDFGAGQFIWRLDEGYVAASDSRRDGQAMGF